MSDRLRAASSILAAVALALGVGLGAPASVAAAEPTFQPATATSTFLDAIEVEQRVTLPSGVARVEAKVRSGGEGPIFLAEVADAGTGATTLRYRHETPGGSIYPNTLVELGFRVTMDDGRVIDGPTATVRYEDTRFDWRTIEGELVRIHWYDGDQAFGRRALAVAEGGIADATGLLGVTEEEPIDFFVYAARDPFYDVLGPALQENVGGIALPEIRTLFANIPPSSVTDPWVGIVVPHELTHLVFDTATKNPYHEPPHWLNEGLADYIAQGYTSGARSSVEQAIRDGDLMPLRAIAGRFPSQAARFSLAYDEAVSAIDYLVRKHGQDALVSLIRSYADGVSDDVAFTAALGLDVDAFEAAWLADLGVAEPPPFGPRPAPAGPLPPGWLEGPAPTPNASARPIASPPPSGPGRDDGTAMTVLLGAGILLVVVLVAGLFVVARGLSRGDPLLPAGAPVPPEDDAPAEADDATPDPEPHAPDPPRDDHGANP